MKGVLHILKVAAWMSALLSVCSPASAGPFYRLRNLDKQIRINSAFRIYETELDQEHADGDLSELKQVARDLRDRPLECIALLLEARLLAEKGGNAKEVRLKLQEGFDVSRRYGLKDQQALFKNRLGFLLVQEGVFQKGLPLIWDSVQHFRKKKFKICPFTAELFLETGKVYAEMGDFQQALVYYRDALHFATSDNKTAVLLELAQACRSLELAKEGQAYLDAALLLIKSGKSDVEMTPVIQKKLGDLLVWQNRPTEAYDFFQKASVFSADPELLLKLSLLDFQKGRFFETEERLREIGKFHAPDPCFQTQVFHLEAQLAQALHWKEGVLDNWKKFAAAQDSCEAAQSALRTRQEKTQLLLQDIHRAYLSEFKTREKKKTELLLLVLGLMSIAGISIYAWNRSTSMPYFSRKKFSVQKKDWPTSPSLITPALTPAEAPGLPNGSEHSLKMQYLSELLHSTILTDADWNRFKRLFEKVHEGFLVRLKDRFPDLTPAETRLLALTRLHLSTKEMADMLGVKPHSIKKTRQRLRKKIHLGEEESFEDHLEQI